MAEKEYIEREAAINAMCRLCSDTTRDKCRIQDICNHVCRLEAVPAADVRPVVRGKWIKPTRVPDSMLDECSVCGFDTGSYTFNYCPNCGADMREERGKMMYAIDLLIRVGIPIVCGVLAGVLYGRWKNGDV